MHLLTGTRYAGDRTLTVSAPVGRPAAFVRAGDPWARRLRAAVVGAGVAAR